MSYQKIGNKINKKCNYSSNKKIQGQKKVIHTKNSHNQIHLQDQNNFSLIKVHFCKIEKVY